MKRILAFALAFVMLLGMIPVAYATEVEELPVEIPVAEQPAPETEPATEATEPVTEETEPVETEPVIEESETAPEETEPAPVQKAETEELKIIDQGTCGANTAWVFYDNYSLVISGTGAMDDYSLSNPAPWSTWNDMIYTIKISDGITKVGAYSFNEECSHMYTLDLGSTVSTIGEYAFYGVPISDLTLPDSVVSVGDYAFYGGYLPSGRDVSIGSGLAELGECALYSGRNEKFIVSAENQNFTAKDGVLYSKDMSTLYCYPARKTAEAYQVDAGTKRIAASAFESAWDLKKVTLPQNLTAIEHNAFDDCYQLADLSLPGSVTELGEYAFAGTAITKIVFPAAFTKIPTGVCNGCKQLQEVTLPEGLLTIGAYAFDLCEQLKSIRLPEGIQTIENGAFYMCDVLEEVNFPDSLTTIGDYAFTYDALKEAILPDSVTYLGKSAFGSNTELTKIRLPAGLKELKSSVLSSTGLTSVDLPEGLEVIEGSVFMGTTITSLTIPAKVKAMGTMCFLGCDALESVKFLGDAPSHTDKNKTPLENTFFKVTTTVYYPQGNATWDSVINQNYGGTLTWVPYAPPCNHTTLTPVPAKASSCTEQGYPAHLICSCGQLFLEDGVTKVTLADILLPLAEHDYKEGNCTVCGAVFPFTYQRYTDMNGNDYLAIWSYTGDDTELVIPAYIDGIPVTALISGFLNEEQKARITGIQLPDTITDISSALCLCKALKEITIPAGVTELGYQAFAGCSSLEKVTFLGDMTAFDEGVFQNCESLKEITIPQGVTSIPRCAFMQCYALTTVNLPASITTIDEMAFWRCSSLQQINLPAGLTEIGPTAFNECTALESVVLPDGLTTISQMSFNGCSSLKEITIPDTVTTIGDAAFGSCSALESIVIPDTVTSLGNGVFQACTGLKEVALPSGLTTISQGLFISCYALEAVDLPVGVTKIETNAFLWCESLQYVSLPLALTEIEGTTFNRCPALKCIRYAGTKEDRDKIVIGVSNDVLNDANWHYEGSCCTPEIRISLDSETQKPMVSWDAKPCLSMYIICRGESPDAVEEQIGMTDGTSWVDETAPHNGCYYTVTGIARDELTEATSSPANLDGKLASPKLTGESVPYSGKPVITWNSIYGAVKYEVYRATSATGKYSKVKTTTETTYLDSSASAAKTYFYKVKAIAKTASKNGPLSDYVSVPCLCAQPAVTIKLNTATGTPELSWQKVSGAVKYEILRASEDSEGYFDVVATQAGTTFKDTTAPADQLCRYLVIAHASSSLYRSVIPELQDRPSIQTGIGQPVLNTASDAATGLPVLTWNAVAGAAEYEISRAVKSSGTYEVICSTDGLRFMDEEAVGGKTYYYKLTAISEKGTRSATSASKAAKSICTAPVADITSDGVTGKPLLLWEKVEGAKKYEIYRATSETGKFSKVATTTALRYIDSKASFGKVYYYKIKAVAASTAYNSDFSQLLSRIVICAQPKLTVKLDAATGKPALTWTKVTGAKNYVVMRAGASGNFTEVFRSGSNATYVDASAVPDLTYQYKVLAEGETVYLNSVDSADPITVTAVCAQPVVTAETDPATGKPKLSWNAVSGGADYEIFRSTKKTGTYTSVCATDGLRFIDEEAAGGKTYYYKVCAYTRMGNAGASSVPASVKSICGRPQVVCGVDFATGKPSLSWNAVSGAKKYEVYRATSETGKYSKISTTTKLSFVDTKAPIAKTFYYKVKAVAASSAYNSALTEAFSAPSLCPRPVVTLKVDPATGKPTLTWKKVTSAVEYEVFRATKENGPYTSLATQTATSYTDEKAQLDSTVYYAVIAKAADASYHSYYSHAVSTTIACGQPVLNAKTDPATGLPTLTWEAVTGAAEYEIYRSTKKTGTYTEICATDGLRFVDTDTVIGKTYYYKLTAKTAKENASVPSAPQSAKRTCGAPVVTVTLDEKGKPVLSWEKVEGAKKYEVYRATSETGKYSKVSTTSSLTYTNTGVSSGKTYYFKVKAVAASSSYSSAYSQIVAVTIP